MTKNKLPDLNDHLFAQMERLGDEDLSGEQLVSEIDRAMAISKVAGKIIASGKLMIDLAEHMHDYPTSKAKGLPGKLDVG